MPAATHLIFRRLLLVSWLALNTVAAAMVHGADMAPPAPVPATLVDAQATAATRKLMAALVSDYGKRTWSGQYHETNDLAHIRTASHLKPAIIGGDFMDYSPSRVAYGSLPDNLTESMISLNRTGQVITMSWRWNAPANLLDSPDQPWWRDSTRRPRRLMSPTRSPTPIPGIRPHPPDIDAIAVQLQKLPDAGVPRSLAPAA